MEGFTSYVMVEKETNIYQYILQQLSQLNTANDGEFFYRTFEGYFTYLYCTFVISIRAAVITMIKVCLSNLMTMNKSVPKHKVETCLVITFSKPCNQIQHDKVKSLNIGQRRAKGCASNVAKGSFLQCIID